MDKPITHSETEIARAFKNPEIPIEFKPDTVGQYREKNNTAVLWKNNHKVRKTDSDFCGDATINGRSYFVQGWTAFKKDGEEYQRLFFRRSKPGNCRWNWRYAKTP